MTGKIIVKDNEYLVEYLTVYGRVRSIPILGPSIDLSEGELVDFEIVDEFSDPSLFQDLGLFEGVPSAKILRGYGND